MILEVGPNKETNFKNGMDNARLSGIIEISAGFSKIPGTDVDNPNAMRAAYLGKS